MRTVLTLFLMFTLVGHSSVVDALTFSLDDANNGTVRLALFDACDLKVEPLAIAVGGQSFEFIKHPTKDSSYFALVAFSYYAKFKKHTVQFVYTKEGVKRTKILGTLRIKKGAYKKEHLKVSSSKVTLSKQDQKRAQKEYAQAVALYKTKTPTLLVTSPLKLPMNSDITSPFGTERLFNGKRKSFHSGVDFRARTPQQVHAIASGKVVLNKNRFYAGKSVVIDHGVGVYSGYYHLSKSSVKVNQVVKAGELVGFSGKSGRITGPHLHLNMTIDSKVVDPLRAIQEINRLFED